VLSFNWGVFTTLRRYVKISLLGAAIVKSKFKKSADPSDVIVESLKASGEAVRQWLTDVCNGIRKEGCIPED